MIGELCQKPEWNALAYHLSSTRAPFRVALAVATTLAQDNGRGLEMGLVSHRFRPRRFLSRSGWHVERLKPIPHEPLTEYD